MVTTSKRLLKVVPMTLDFRASTEDPMWGYPVFVLGAISSFLEPFCGHLSPKLDKLCSRLTFEIPPRRALRGCDQEEGEIGLILLLLSTGNLVFCVSRRCRVARFSETVLARNVAFEFPTFDLTGPTRQGSRWENLDPNTLGTPPPTPDGLQDESLLRAGGGFTRVFIKYVLTRV